MISESSSALYTATRGRVWFGQVSIVLPPLWTDAYCQTEIKYPTENIPYKVSFSVALSLLNQMYSRREVLRSFFLKLGVPNLQDGFRKKIRLSNLKRFLHTTLAIDLLFF